MEKKPITPLAAGLVIGLTSVVLFLAYYFMGIAFQQDWVRWIPILIYASLIIVFISVWSNAKNNFVTFGNCFGFGFKSVCIAVLIIFFFTFLFIYLTPEFKEQFLQVSREQARQNKQATDEQIEQGMAWVSAHTMLLILGAGLFFNLFIGLLAALIGAAVAKKKPFSPFTQVNQIGETQP